VPNRAGKQEHPLICPALAQLGKLLALPPRKPRSYGRSTAFSLDSASGLIFASISFAPSKPQLSIDA